VCETARRRRNSLHLQDRIRNVPFDERACASEIIVARSLSNRRQRTIDIIALFPTYSIYAIEKSQANPVMIRNGARCAVDGANK
jgi:hypothetical protein